MKKVLSFILLISILAGVLIGCKNNDGSNTDTTVADTTASDTTASDTTASDTTVADTTVADTTAAETTTADTAVSDTTVADTTVADTTDAETTAAETTKEEPPVATGFTVSEGILFADLSVEKRSSHCGHALVEYAPGKILAFYPNTDGEMNGGHNCKGWTEYKRSEDGGKTWSDPIVLQYSKDQMDNQESYVFAQEAILTKDGKLVLILQRFVYDNSQAYGSSRHPTYLISDDNGVTWGEAKEFAPFGGRVWDATITEDGTIYALMQRGFVNEQYHAGDGVYLLFKSDDNGRTFEKCADVAFERGTQSYGNLVVTPEGKIIVYTYQYNDEYNLRCYISDDGISFNESVLSHCAKKIRNPQVIYLNGWYFLHGRSGNDGPYFVLYSSRDGLNWDEGTYISKVSAGFPGSCYYSNNLVVGDNKILIQASDNYESARTNVKHWWIELTTD